MNHRLSLLLSLLVATAAAADDSGWQTTMTGPIVIKNRAIKGTDLNEVWAEGDIAAPVGDVQDALLDTSNLNKFMPYLKSSRELTEADAENSRYIYTVIDLPVVGKRDYVVRVWVMETAKDNTGTFRQRWEATPEYLPKRESILRITTNSGSWQITPTGENSCHAVYRFTVNPGGWLPGFIVNTANEKGVAPTFDAIQKEALKRKAARLTPAPTKK